MTRPLVLDFETYFDSKYTLRRKSNTMSTSLYIRDSRFLAHCVSVWLPEEEEFPRLYWYDDIAKALKKYPWKQIELICHHTHFDGLILSHHYGIIPQRYGCTLSMARAWHGADTPADLGTLAQWHGFQNKLVDISALAKGVRFFEPGVKRALFGDYCKADTANTWFVRQSMLSQGFPSAEMDLIERTIRMFADPILRVDRKLAESELLRERTEKEQKIEVAGVPVDDLQSAEAFANLLRERGVEPPIKVSARTGEETYAFAKTDLMFQKLLGHEDEDVRELIEARLAAKSTIGETRAAAIIARSYKTIVVDDETKTLKGRGTALLPIYVNFAKAHTLRWSGGDKFNPQNLTAARGKRKHVKIRHCIKAPPGHKLVILDSSQIELRVNAMLHDEKWLLKALREKRDVYSEFATSFYGRTITKKDEIERFVGKTATLGLGFGMGAPKFRYTLALGTTGPAVFISSDESKYAVDLWRKTNSSIVAGWYALERLISVLAVGSRRKAEYGPLRFEEGLVHMPNGLALHYPEMRLGEDGWTYRLGRAYKRMWGGIADENFVQSLARIIVGEQLAKINYRLVLTSHDEFVFCVPTAKAKDCYQRALEAMSTAPKWWPHIPLTAEGHISDNYNK